MKKAKLIKQKKVENTKIEEGYSIKLLLTIIIILVIVFAVFYLITVLVVKNDNKETINPINTQIDSSKIVIGNLLDRKESEYYVLATKESLYKNYNKADYINIYNEYIKDIDNFTFYKVDLDDALNKNYVSDKSNIVNDLNGLKVSDETLFKISNGEIIEYYEGNKEIIDALSKLKES